MPDDISQAKPEEAITPEAEVQETDTEEVITPEEPQKEKPLTREEYRAIAREEATRAAQSHVAKGENRINQRIKEELAALEKSRGVLKLTDDQVEKARNDIVVKAYAEPDEPQASGLQGQPPTDEIIRQQAEFVYGQINATFKDVGTEVTPNDAEFKMIEAALNDPQGSIAKTIRATVKAAEAKAARLEAQRKNAAARVVGGGGNSSDSNDISNITDAKILYKLGEKKIGGRK